MSIFTREELREREYACNMEDMEQPVNFYAEKPRPTPEEKLFQAFREKDAEAIRVLREEYENAYQNQLEGITAIFDFAPFLENRKKMEDPNLEKQEKLQAILGCTEYQYLLTHFIDANGKDKKFLERFWETIEGIARATHNADAALPLRHGVLSQVATYKIFKILGKQPNFSVPKDDAFNAIDLWVSNDEAVQVKGSPYSTASIIETDAISPSGVSINAEGKTEYYSGFLMDNIQKFKLKISRYGKTVGHEIKGHLVVVPYEEFDPVTGEPTEKIVDLVKKNLEKSGNSAASEGMA